MTPPIGTPYDRRRAQRPPKSRWSTATLIELVVLTVVGIVGVVTVTAMEGSSTISVSLPSLEQVILAAIAFLFEEMIRRGLKKLDTIGGKCDRTHARLEQYQTKIDGALMGIDGRGGIVMDIRELQSEVARLLEERQPPKSARVSS